MLEARLLRICLDSSHCAVHPLSDGTVCVMIEGVHICAPHTSVILQSIPVFPDCGSTFLYLIQPGWEILLQKQVISILQSMVLTQRMAEIRSSYKSGNQMSVFLGQQLLQAFHCFFNIFLRSELEIQCHNMCGLCLSCHITLCIKEGILEFLHDLTVKLLIFCCHIILSKSLRHFYEKSGGICIVCSAGQIIWSCTEIASLFCIQSNPVTKL